MFEFIRHGGDRDGRMDKQIRRDSGLFAADRRNGLNTKGPIGLSILFVSFPSESQFRLDSEISIYITHNMISI